MKCWKKYLWKKTQIEKQYCGKQINIDALTKTNQNKE